MIGTGETSKSRVRRAGAFTTVLAVVLLGLPFAPAGAAVVNPFAVAYQQNINGAITLAGNTSMGCSPLATCVPGSANNNAFTMLNRDADVDPVTTTNSSSADLAIPAGSTVRFAGLYWGARTVAGTSGTSTALNPRQVKFRRPGGLYQTLTASQFDVDGSANNTYQGFVDVTSLASVGGTYWVGDIAAGTGQDRFAGWSLVVAYENPALPLRNLTVFDGYAAITTNSSADSTVDIPINGFLTPPFGAVNATVGMVTYEGDRGTTGDQIYFNASGASNGTRLIDSSNPTSNTANSSISAFGSNVTTRSNPVDNTLGFDIDLVNATGILANSQTSTTVRLTTTGDFYYPGVVTTQIDLYAPMFPAVTKTAVDVNGGNVEPGDVITYTVAYTNTGLDPADSSVVTDTMPAGMSYLPGSTLVLSGPPTQPTGAQTDATGDDLADLAAGVLTVRLGRGATASSGGSINPDDTTSFSFQATVGAGVTSGVPIDNVSKLSYRARTINQLFTHMSNVAAITPLYTDIAVTKTASPSPAVAGQLLTYTIGLTQTNGPSNGTTVSDPLPAGVSFVSAAVGGGTGTCAFTAGSPTGSVGCSLGTLSGGSSRTVTVTVRAEAALASGMLLTNRATVANDGTVRDIVPANDTATVVTPVDARADLAVTKTASPTPVVPGKPVTWTLAVTNNGPSTARSATLDDPLPAGTSYVGHTTTAGSCTGGTTVVCALGDIAVATTVTVTVTAAVAGSYPGTTLVNAATARSTTTDPNAANNTGEVTSTVTPGADVAITKTASPNPVVPGRPVTWTLVATNNGPSDAANVVVTDPLPSGTTFTSATPAACGFATGVVSCPLGTLAAGSSTTITVTAAVAASLSAATLSNTATIATTTADPAPTNNTATSATPVRAEADLTVTKTGTPNPVVAGQSVTYTITIANAGPSDASGVVAVDNLPAAFTFNSVSASQGSCTPPVAATLSCSLGAAAPGAPITITLVVDVPSGFTPAPVTNVASVSSPTVDPDPSDNTARFTTDVGAQADVALTKTATPAPVVAGETITWTLRAANNGPSVAQAVFIADAVPAGVTLTTPLPAGCSAGVGGVVTCALGAVPVGGAVAVTLTGTVAADYVAARGNEVVNSATVASSTTDPATSNNQASTVTPVVASADLTLAKSASPDPVIAGADVTWRLVAANTGSSLATDVVLSDTLPLGVTVVAPVPAGCAVTGRTVTCALGDLAPGGSVTVDLVTTVAAATASGATVANQASIDASTPDPDPSDNRAEATVAVVTRADLAIAKTASPSPAVAGRSVTWTVTVTNAGPSDAASVAVADTSPAGVRVTAVTPSVGSCTAAGACTLGTLAAGASATVTVAAEIDPDFVTAPGGDLVNRATVSSPTDPTDSTATSTTPVTASADLRITKTATPTSAIPGATLAYVLTVTNDGPSTARDVTVTDTLAASLTLLAGSGCTAAAQVVSCAVASLAPGASTSFTLPVRVGSAVTGNVDNTASVASPTPDPDPSDNASSVAVPTSPQADLQATKVSPEPAVVAGGRLTWVLQLINNGPSDAVNAVLDDPLPAGLTGIVVTASEGTCTTAVSCAFPLVSGGAIVTVQVEATVPPDWPQGATALRNTVTVSSATPDPGLFANTATATTAVEARSDLSVTKTDSPDPVIPGNQITYTVVVRNAGPSSAANVVVTDTLPAALTGVIASSPAGACSLTGSTLLCAGGNLDPSGSVTIRITATVSASASAASMTNRVTVESDSGDPNPLNDTASAATRLTPRADLVVTKTARPEPVVPGQPVTYTVTVRNAGPSDAQAVTLADPLPAALLTPVATPSQGSCAAPTSCALGALAAGASATVQITGTVDPIYTGATLVNAATASSTTPDPDTTNNAGSVTSTNAPSADVSITKVAAAAPVTAGEQVSWTLTVRNDGPSAAQAVTVTDPLPAGVSFVSATAPCALSSGDVVCPLGVLAVGAERVLTVTGLVSSDFVPGALANEASVASTTADSDTVDNRATASVAVVASADLSLAKSVKPDPATAGRTATYTLTVANAGPSDAQTVVVNDTLPAGLTVGSVGAGCTGAVGGTTVSCAAATIADGGSAAFTVVVDIAPGATGTLTNAAAVAAATADPDPANNAASVDLAVATLADVSVTKTVSPDPVVAGETVRWTLTVANAGPSDAQTVTLTDVVPAGVSDPAVESDPSGTCAFAGSGGTTLSCPFGTLANGGTRQVTIAATVRPGQLADVANSATVASATADPDTADNGASAPAGVTTRADLRISKTALPSPVVAGETITWTITVTNDGPSVSRNVVVTDPLPAGLTDVVAAGCNTAANPLVCTVGDLGPNGSRTFTVRATVPAAQTADLANTATVSGTEDPDPENNASSVTVPVDAAAALDIVKTASSSDLVAGTEVDFTFTVTNAGPSDAASVSVADTLPPGLTVVSVGAGCAGVAGATALTCSADRLAVGASIAFTVRVAVGPGQAAGPLTNTATVSSPTDPSDSSDELPLTVRRSADLQLTKAASPATVIAGEAIAYRLTVANLGPSVANTVVVSDQLPAGLTVRSLDPRCAESAGLVTCRIASLDDDAATTFEIVATVASGRTGALDNTARAATATPDPVATNDEAATSTPVDSRADLSIAKALSPSPIVAGTSATFTLTVSNAGPSDALDVTVTDTVDGAFTLVTPLPAGCTSAGLAVTCTGSQLVAGGDAAFAIGVILAEAQPAGTLTNTAAVASSTPDPDSADRTVTIDVPTSTRADLELTKTASPAELAAGEDVNYTFSVVNRGPSTAVSVAVSDTLPAGLTVVSVGAGCTGDVGAMAVACTVATLASGATQTFTVVAHVAETAAAARVVNNASVTSQTPDPDPADNGANAPVTVTQSADVRLTKTASAAVVTAGTEITFTLTATNAGPSLARNVRVEDALPAGLTVVGVGPGCTISTDRSEVSCSVAELTSAGEIAFTVTVLVAADQPAGPVTNTALASSDTPDPDPADNDGAVTVSVTTAADLSVTKSATPTPAVAGRPISWTVTVANAGPSDARTVVVTDTVPAGVTVTSLDPRCTQVDQTVTCRAAVLANGADTTFAIVGDVASSATNPLVNTAVVDSATPDPDPTNDDARLSTTLRTSADLRLVKTVTPTPARAGTEVTYRLTVTNDGPSDALGVVVADTLPAGLGTVIAPASCAVAALAVRCPVGTVANGDSATVFVRATVLADQLPGTITNAASVGSDTADPDPADNGAIAPLATVAEADLRIAKTATPLPVVAGTDVVFTLVVTNDGPSTARDIVVSDPLPAGFTIVSVGLGCTGAAGTTTVTCPVAVLAPDDTRTFTVTARLASDRPAGAPVNTATVDAATPDPDPTDNEARLEVPTRVEADLQITKEAAPVPVVAGTDVTFTLTVTNLGPSDATGVTVTDTLAGGFSIVTLPAGCTALGQTVTCVRAVLADGGVAAFPIVARLAAGQPAAGLTNNARVASTSFDPAADNNSATVALDSATSADLSIKKSADPLPVVAGTTTTFTFAVANAGPSDAQAVTVADELPVGFTVVSVGAGCVAQPGDTRVSCTQATIPARTSAAFTVVVRVTSDHAAGSVDNTATVSSTAPDPVAIDNASTLAVPVTTSADLSVTKVASPNPAVAGTDVTYTFKVANAGPSLATDLVVSDAIPAGLTMTATGLPAGCAAADGAITCRQTSLAAGAQTSFAVTFRVAADRLDGITNTASVDSPTPDPDPGNNGASEDLAVVTSADSYATKSASPNPVVAGTDVTFTVTVGNLGPSVARSVAVSDLVPAGLTVGAVPSGCELATGPAVVCRPGDLAVGQEVSYQITARVAADRLAPVTNTATATSTTPDPAAANNAPSVLVEITLLADLSVTKSASPNPVVAGTEVSYELSVSNAGPSLAQQVVVSDAVPVGLTVTAVDAPCALTAGVVTCTVGTVAAGASTVLRFRALVATDRTGPISNSATLTSPTADPDPEDRTTTVSTPVVASADLRLTKRAVSATVVTGTDVTYKLTVSNDGPSDAVDVVVTDPMAAGLTVVSVGGGCAAGPPVRCAVARLAPGATITFTVVARVDAQYRAATVENRATVGSATPDPDVSDNAATAVTPAERRADLVVTKTVDDAALYSGERSVFTVTVRNDGPSEADGVVVDDPLPAGLVLRSAVATPGSYDTATGAWSVGTLAVGASATLELTVEADAAAAGSTVTNRVTGARSDVADPDPSDNQPTSSVDISPVADLAVTKTVDKTTANLGDTVTFTVTVANRGPNRATNVALRETLPAGLRVDKVTPSTGTWSSGVEWQIPEILNGVTATLTVVGVVTATGALTNAVAIVDVDQHDPDTRNDGAAAGLTVAPAADLVVQKTVTPNAAGVGDTVSYDITVANRGPDAATGVTLIEQLPDGVQLQRAEPTTGTFAGATWTIGDLAVGATARLRVTATVIAEGSLENRVEVRSSTFDPASASNVAVAAVTATRRPATAIATPPAVTSDPLVRTGAQVLQLSVFGLVLIGCGLAITRLTRRRGLG